MEVKPAEKMRKISGADIKRRNVKTSKKTVVKVINNIEMRQ